MNILILGNDSDAHAAHIKDALTQAGAEVDYLDTYLFPRQLRLSWQPDTLVGCLTLPGGRQLNFQDIHSVFWRNFSGVYVPPLKDANQQQVAFYDSMSTVRCSCKLVRLAGLIPGRPTSFTKKNPYN
jgi:hypothetical protein